MVINSEAFFLLCKTFALFVFSSLQFAFPWPALLDLSLIIFFPPTILMYDIYRCWLIFCGACLRKRERERKEERLKKNCQGRVRKRSMCTYCVGHTRPFQTLWTLALSFLLFFYMHTLIASFSSPSSVFLRSSSFSFFLFFFPPPPFAVFLWSIERVHFTPPPRIS